mgnify:CR=1 FL=1
MKIFKIWAKAKGGCAAGFAPQRPLRRRAHGVVQAAALQAWRDFAARGQNRPGMGDARETDWTDEEVSEGCKESE